MQKKQVSVLGGSGFVGSAVVTELQAEGYAVNVLTRRAYRAKHLKLLPDVSITECDVFDEAALSHALQGTDAVINMIGILHQSHKLSFDLVHHQLPAMVGKVCRNLGISRLVQMSSLGADQNAPSEYLKSKGAGEAALASLQSSLNITVFKPSIIFGRDDRFTNLFATIAKYMPVILLAKPEAKFQPVWVEDVAKCMVASVQNIATFGETYELAGPTVYTFKALVQLITNTLGVKRCIIGLCDKLAYTQAFMMELLPIKLMSRDNVKSMEVDSVSNAPFPAIFNVEPTALEAIMPDYLVDETQRGAYNAFRQYAARK
jgi:uncharacterized protein YbjT (DUF2867 family)